MSTASTTSPTLIGRRAPASRFRISTRDASPRHRNQLAHTSADPRSTYINIESSRYWRKKQRPSWHLSVVIHALGVWLRRPDPARVGGRADGLDQGSGATHDRRGDSSLPDRVSAGGGRRHAASDRGDPLAGA